MTIDLFNTVMEVVAFYMKTISLDECKEYIMEKGVINRNTKLKKGENFNVGLELLPAKLSGKNLCPSAGVCKYNCLAFCGTGNVLTYKRIYEQGLPAPLLAKVKRTKVFLEDRDFFEKVLRADLTSAKVKAELLGREFGVRLNTTSDVDWTDFIATMPDVQFYDYTKVMGRFKKAIPANYHLTYSANEKTTLKMVKELIEKKINVAMVFKKVPTSWHTIPVISGDDDDNRYDDATGVIIGLKYKNAFGANGDTETICFDNK